MKKRFLSVLLCLCMVLMLAPTTVFAAGTSYDLSIGDSRFTIFQKNIIVGNGTATFDSTNLKLTLNNITLNYDNASKAAIHSEIPNLEIELHGKNTINIPNNGMAGIYLSGGGNTKITGTAGSELIINSAGQNNMGITTSAGVSLTMTDTNLIVNDNTTSESTKGYMVGIKPCGDFTMEGCSYTANGVQSGIEMYTDCVAALYDVSFNIKCTPRKSFSSTVPNEMSFGLNLAPLTGKQNLIVNCSGSITAHYPLYADGVTVLSGSQNLTLTTDNYASVYVKADLTVSGGTLNLASTGSSGNGFYASKNSSLVFSASPDVTVNVGNVAVFLSGDSASAVINSGTLKTTAKAGVLLSESGNTFTLVNGTLDMTPKTGEAQAIGIQSYGTVSIEGGSIKTSAGMYSGIQNVGEKPFSLSGGTHTLSAGTGTGGYLDTAKSTLNISGTADVTLDGWITGMNVYGELNLSGGKLTVRNGNDGIYTEGKLNLTGGTLNISGSRTGVLAGEGGLVSFAGTNATLVGETTAGWGYASVSADYSVTGGKVVLQGGIFAASTIYSTLAKGYGVYAGSNESNMVFIGNPTTDTFTQNTYVRIEPVQEVSDEADILSAVKNNVQKLVLKNDIKLSTALDLSHKNITLDLNGYVISGANISINTGNGNASLTLKDSRPTAAHTDSTLPSGGVVTSKILMNQSGGSYHDCVLYGNGGTVTSDFSPNTNAVAVKCTSNTPTAFTGKISGYAHLYGGIYYGGVASTVKFERKKITFKNGDNIYAYEVVESGYNTVEPIAPPYNAETQTFDGWFNGDNKYTFGSALSEDITLTAKFTDLITYIAGDANCDGKVNLLDAILAQRAALELLELDEQGFANADMNSDGKITIFDAIAIQKLVLS
ncbi:MAG: dockerin type I domain-containing protein [Acutalibacteraceae bacterium]